MQEIKEIQKDCLEGRIAVTTAVDAIDITLQGIETVDFRADRAFKITAQGQRHALSCQGLPKKQLKRLYALAVMVYMRAQKNGSVRPGEVHISRGASTKHHMQGIREIATTYSCQYFKAS